MTVTQAVHVRVRSRCLAFSATAAMFLAVLPCAHGLVASPQASAGRLGVAAGEGQAVQTSGGAAQSPSTTVATTQAGNNSSAQQPNKQTATDKNKQRNENAGGKRNTPPSKADPNPASFLLQQCSISPSSKAYLLPARRNFTAQLPL